MKWVRPFLLVRVSVFLQSEAVTAKGTGHRTAQGHRAGVDVDVTPPTGGPVGHPPPIRRPCVTAVRREVNRDTQGHLQNTQT